MLFNLYFFVSYKPSSFALFKYLVALWLDLEDVPRIWCYCYISAPLLYWHNRCCTLFHFGYTFSLYGKSCFVFVYKVCIHRKMPTFWSLVAVCFNKYVYLEKNRSGCLNNTGRNKYLIDSETKIHYIWISLYYTNTFLYLDHSHSFFISWTRLSTIQLPNNKYITLCKLIRFPPNTNNRIQAQDIMLSSHYKVVPTQLQEFRLDK